MSILRITKADIARTKTLDAGWYKAAIIKVSDSTPSKDKQSTNVIVTFGVEDANGKQLDHYYNSKLLGMMVPMIEAAKGIKLTDDYDVDSTELVGCKLDIKLIVELYNGIPQNKIEAYLPYGSGNNAKTSF